MALTILLFELRQRLRRISTYVYFLILFALGTLFMSLSGGAFPGAFVDFGTGGKVLVNSPYALNQIIVYIAVFGVIITASLAGQATFQDVDSNSTAFFYTAPITKFDYLMGRFLGVLCLQFLIFSSIGLGAWLAVHTPWLDRTRVGPEHLMNYLQPYIYLVIPNLILTTAIFFAIAALGRRMLPVYAGSVILLISVFIAGQMSTGISTSLRSALLDPFGSNAIDRITQYWTPFERNTQLIPFTGPLLLNRILWVGLGILVFGLTYARFSFSVPSRRRGKDSEPDGVEAVAPVPALYPVAHPVFSVAAHFSELVSLTRLQFTETVKNVFFAVMVLAGAIFSFIAASGLLDPERIPVYPVTYRMTEQGAGGFTVFALLIITFYAGELVWRERDAGMAQIADATPAPRWVMFSSKLGALMLVQVVLMFLVMAVGLLVQVIHGYYHFQFGLYFTELFGIRLVGFWVLCVFALFIHTLVNQKYLGHFVMVLYYIALIALPPMGFQHHLYLLGSSPFYIFSDMNGYGPYAAPIFWFHLYWALFAVALAIITNLLWVRGMEGGWRLRLRLAVARFTGTSRAALAVSLLAFVAVGGFIYYNTNVLNTYRNTFRNDEDRAQYEKKYIQYLSMKQPRVTDMTLNIDLDNAHRVTEFSGSMWLENKTGKPMDRVALTIWPEDITPLPRPIIEVRKLSFTGGQTPVIQDDALGFYIFQLASPLPPEGRTELQFDLRYPNPGFVNGLANGDIVSNGSFVSNAYVPYVGYWKEIELTDDSARHRHGLPPSRRLPPLSDLEARQFNADGTESDWVNFEGTVSTDIDQIAVMPGYLQKDWVANGRRYFHYKMDAPILGIVSMNSARYAVMRDHWHDVNLEIYYQPDDAFNLDVMMRGLKATLDYCTAAYSPYQFHQLRILEFPRYGTFAESFPNTIPYSEEIGFITYLNPKKGDAINMPFFVTAHETAHQWWGHQVDAAAVEGETSVVETLAQYTALMVMQHTYGPESMRKFLRFQLDGYLRGRAQEHNEENPLYKVQPYQGYIHYNKGGLVMYSLQDYIGEAAVSRALSNFVKAYAFKGPPYSTSLDLIEYLKKETPPEYMYLYDDLFENITLYENRAVSAYYTARSDGKYDVHLSVESHKYRADGRGEEHEVPVHDLFDVGVLDAGGHYLYLQKHLVDRNKMDFTVTVDKLPAQAGIDPLSKMIDRNPDDNVIRVSKK
jgi:ABC-2 type transport system permease protein